jgi:hypothetical protein
MKAWRASRIKSSSLPWVGILYAQCEWRHLFVNLSLTISSAFSLLKDLRRNRLSGRLMPLNPAPTPDKYEEKTARDAIGTGCADGAPAQRMHSFLKPKYI